MDHKQLIKYVDNYSRHIQTSDLAESTKKEYYKLCCEFAVELRIKKLKHFVGGVVQYYIEQVTKDYSPSRKRKMYIVIKNAVRMNNLLESNQIVIPRIIHQRKKPIPTWTHKEYEFFITNANYAAALIAKVAYLTGQRVSDLVEIKRFGPYNEIQLCIMSLTQKKTGTKCYIPITEELYIINNSSIHKYLVHDILGNNISPISASYQIKREIKRLDMRKELSIHGLRRLCAANMAAKGCTVYEIAAVTGHLNVNNLSIYTESYDRSEAALGALKKLAA